jgi:signal peptidase I
MENDMTQKETGFAPERINTVEPKRRKGKPLWDLIKFVFTVLVIVVPIRAFVAQPFIVSGESMSPTFDTKDYLIIDEISYHVRDPLRGEVIVFHPPGQPQSVYYIKRVIGLPGDTLKIEDGKVTIINDEHKDGFTLDEPYIEFPSHEAITQKLGPDEYYVLGDNRARSSDSRFWGILPRKNIVGRALVRLYPFNEINILPGVHSYAQEK